MRVCINWTHFQRPYFHIATLRIMGCVFFLNRNMNTFYWRKKHWCIIFYLICYVEIQLHRVSKFVVLMYICYLTVICIPIQSHQSNQTCSTALRNFISCQYSYNCLTFYDLQYMHIYSGCCLRTIYAKYLNSTTK